MDTRTWNFCSNLTPFHRTLVIPDTYHQLRILVIGPWFIVPPTVLCARSSIADSLGNLPIGIANLVPTLWFQLLCFLLAVFLFTFHIIDNMVTSPFDKELEFIILSLGVAIGKYTCEMNTSSRKQS